MVSLHERAKDVFLAALDRPADVRRRFVAEACGTDLALFAEVESLLRFHEETGGTHGPGQLKWGQTPGSDPRPAAPDQTFRNVLISF